MSTLHKRYLAALRSIPAPGTGGCHTSLLGVADLGVMIGLDDHQLFADIRGHIPQGSRTVPDSEIHKTILRARQDVIPVDDRPNDYQPPKRPKQPAPRKNGTAQRDFFISQGAGCGEADWFDFSPVELPPANHNIQYPDHADYRADFAVLVRHLYRWDEYIFVGDQYGGRECVRRVDDWLTAWQHGLIDWVNSPHIIANPLTGDIGTTHTGKPSYRADSCVADRRYCIVEFDDMPIEQQFEFWAGIPLPIVALINSGGKSLHAWIRVDSPSAEHWGEMVAGHMYKNVLIPMGVDSACSNPSRLSRTPGRFRTEKDNWQRLLYLAPQGRPLCATT